MSNDVVMGFIRHVLTLLGGVLVTKGWLTDAQMPELVGAVMTFVGFGWSFFDKSVTQPAKIAEAAATGVDPNVAPKA